MAIMYQDNGSPIYIHGAALIHEVNSWWTEPKKGVHYYTVCNFVGFHAYGEGSWLSTKRLQIPTCLWCIAGASRGRSLIGNNALP